METNQKQAKKLFSNEQKSSATKRNIDQLKNKYNILNLLASGSFADVYLVACRHDASKMFAAKIIRQVAPGRNVEAEVLMEFRHKNLVRGVEAVNSNIFVMEHLVGKTLQQYLEEEGKIAEVDASGIMYRVACGLGFLHGNMTSHGDLKPDNVIMCSSGDVKLIDFGLSTRVNGGSSLVEPLSHGNVVFAAPEVARMQKYDPLKADVWSFGVVLYLMTTGRALESSCENEMYFPCYVSNLLETFLKTSLLRVEPSERKSVEDVLEEKWLQRGKFFKVRKDL